MHMVTSSNHVAQPAEPENDEPDETECSSRPAKKARRSNDKEPRFSKLFGDIFNRIFIDIILELVHYQIISILYFAWEDQIAVFSILYQLTA